MNLQSQHQTQQKVKKTQPKTQPNQEPSLKGTFISVLLLGAFIVATWFGVFNLFINRG
ncbi:cytochrome c oxidase subunit 2A [Brevibacillus dissolubilis]|uniref:cytochrome c oxidase subunit 2A n=1 Tax=Brevibacillus dissolubilis TaxID=1844116 RepID=UPI0011162647|nr:cytochrome c oxidase subunit 2A [Brevibacillus dissolubilis]